jgi:hypothetical protein
MTPLALLSKSSSKNLPTRLPAIVGRRPLHEASVNELNRDRMHEETTHSPQAWYYQAEALLRSAEYLLGGLQKAMATLTDSRYTWYGLLLGYSIECSFKGRWVAKGNTLVSEKGWTGVPRVRDHDLQNLAVALALSLTADELRILDRLSYFVRTVGRYPVPKRSHEMASREVPGRGLVDPGFSADDWSAARAIAHKYLEELRDNRFSS